jgi:hypothetical protein
MTSLSLPLILMVPLVALIAFQLHEELSPASTVPTIPMTVMSARAEVATPLQNLLPDLRTADVAILNRPLFSPSRRPLAQTSVPRAGLPRLTGIMISKTGRFAIFAPARGKPIIATPGDAINNFTIRSIDADAVTVAGPEGVVTVRTSFTGPAGQITTSLQPTSIYLAPARALTLPGGITLAPPTRRNFPSSATWPGLTHVSGLTASQSEQLLGMPQK